MAAVAAFDYRRLRDWAIPIVGVALVLLFGVLTPLGAENKGIQAWYELAGFQLQPAELAKLALIVGLAAFLTLEQQEIDGRRLATILGISAVPMALIMLQPDLGTVLVFGVVTLAVVFIAGARPRHFAVLLLIGIVATVGILNSNVLADYQQDRLTNFAAPDSDADGSGYNQAQSQNAIGAGRLAGQGLFDGTQTGLGFVPEQHTDFIFTVVGEELGFLGGAALLALFTVILWRIWRTAQLARDEFGMLVCVGVLAMFLFQIFENVGHGHGDHAGDRHPPAVDVLRRLVDPDRLRRHRPGAQRAQPPLPLSRHIRVASLRSATPAAPIPVPCLVLRTAAQRH